MSYLVNASTSLVLAEVSSIVLLSSLNAPGTLVTIRDYQGAASSNSTIILSTTQGITFLDGLSSYKITQPYGFLTVSPKTSTIWTLTNSFAFPDQTAASIDQFTAKIANLSTTYANVISTKYINLSSLGVNCNAPTFEVDVSGAINATAFYVNGTGLTASGNISTLNTSSMNIKGGQVNVTTSSNSFIGARFDGTIVESINNGQSWTNINGTGTGLPLGNTLIKSKIDSNWYAISLNSTIIQNSVTLNSWSTITNLPTGSQPIVTDASNNLFLVYDNAASKPLLFTNDFINFTSTNTYSDLDSIYSVKYKSSINTYLLGGTTPSDYRKVFQYSLDDTTTWNGISSLGSFPINNSFSNELQANVYVTYYKAPYYYAGGLFRDVFNFPTIVYYPGLYYTTDISTIGFSNTNVHSNLGVTSITDNGSRLIATTFNFSINNSGPIHYSDDGVNWISTAVLFGGNGPLYNANSYYDSVSNQFIVTTYNNNSLYSSNGITWNTATNGANLTSIQRGSYGISKPQLAIGQTYIYTEPPIEVGGSNQIYFYSTLMNFNNTLFIDNSGFVGIGTSSFAGGFTVSTSAFFQSTLFKDGITVPNLTEVNSSILNEVQTLIFSSITTSTLNADFIQTSSIGVNCNAPSFTLDVSGTINASQIIYTKALQTEYGFSNRKNIILSQSQGQLFYSLDRGSNWTQTSGISDSPVGRALPCWNGFDWLYFIPQVADKYMYKSYDGINWSPISTLGYFPAVNPFTVPSLGLYSKMKWVGDSFVLLYSGNATYGPEMIRSFDGINWSQLTTTITTYFLFSYLNDFLINNNRYFVVGTNTNTGNPGIYYSDDYGSNWYLPTGTISYLMNTITSANGYIIAGGIDGGSGSILYSSDNGSSFTPGSGTFTLACDYVVECENGRFIAAGNDTGSNSYLKISTDNGGNWANLSMSYTDLQWTGLTYTGSEVIASAYNSGDSSQSTILLKSSDFTTVTELPYNNTTNPRYIEYSSNTPANAMIGNLSFYTNGQSAQPFIGNLIETSFSTLNFNNSMYIRTNGSKNVGINCNAPSYTLDVSGIINASSILINGIPITTTDTLQTSNIFTSSIGVNCNSPFYTLDVSGSIHTTEYLYATQGIGVNCNTPSYTVDVNGDINALNVYTNGSLILPTAADINLSSITVVGNGAVSSNLFIPSSFFHRPVFMSSLTTSSIRGLSNSTLDIPGILKSDQINSLSTVGIRTTNPTSVLDITVATDGSGRYPICRNVLATDSNISTFMTQFGTSNVTMWPTVNGNIIYLYTRTTNQNRRVQLGTTAFFTGQHANMSVDTRVSNESLSSCVGLIVSSADQGYISIKENGTIVSGSNAIWITEALPKIKLTDKDKDKAVWGVITNHQNEMFNSDGTRTIDYFNTAFSSPLQGRVRINGSGEGAIWVTNINGILENGDYICSSAIPGYGRKQEDDLLHNYTVAKITMSCYFKLNQSDYICEEFQYNGRTYRRAFVGCSYHCS